MQTSLPSLLAMTGLALASVVVACTLKPSLDAEIQQLVERSRECNAALMRGDAARWSALVNLADDFTLMSPFGGRPSHGVPTPAKMAEIAKFFRNGSLEQELVHAYGSQDMIVLAIIERSRVEVGDLPAQDWALRVTLVYRRDAGEWRLVHRHADPLANAISVTESAQLARGGRTKEALR